MFWFRAAALTALVTLATSAEALGQGSNQPVHVEQLMRRLPTGKLGKPLGTMVTIGGYYEVREPNNPRAKAPPSTTLVIDSVAGEALLKSVRYPFEEDILFRAVRPANGERFRLRGYEAGGFYGLVEGELEIQRDDVARAAPAPFKFIPRFHVLKDELRNISEQDAANGNYPRPSAAQSKGTK